MLLPPRFSERTVVGAATSNATLAPTSAIVTSKSTVPTLPGTMPTSQLAARLQVTPSPAPVHLAMTSTAAAGRGQMPAIARPMSKLRVVAIWMFPFGCKSEGRTGTPAAGIESVPLDRAGLDRGVRVIDRQPGRDARIKGSRKLLTAELSPYGRGLKRWSLRGRPMDWNLRSRTSIQRQSRCGCSPRTKYPNLQGARRRPTRELRGVPDADAGSPAGTAAAHCRARSCAATPGLRRAATSLPQHAPRPAVPG